MESSGKATGAERPETYPAHIPGLPCGYPKDRIKISTGLSQGTVKVMKDPDVQKEGTALNISSSESISEGEVIGHPLPRMTVEEQQI
jgi:hypothetical protein